MIVSCSVVKGSVYVADNLPQKSDFCGKIFDFKDLSTQKEDHDKRYGVGKHFLSSFWENKKISHPITFWSRNRLITTARVNNSSLKPNRFFDFKDLSTQKKDCDERYGVGKDFLSSFWEKYIFSSPVTF